MSSQPAATPRDDLDLRPWLWALCAWHLLAWVIAPMLAYRMLPLDTLELLGWGQEWQWGYYKHPPLGAWLGEAWLQLFGARLEALYLLAQACVVVALLYVWRTARLFLDPTRALLATLLLEGSYAYTYLSPNFNMNLLQLPVWAGLGFHFLRALQGGPRWHWLAAGAFAALCLLSKYSGLLPIAGCAAAVLLTREGRAALRSAPPWLGAALALLLLAPHLHWLWRHADLPLQYLRGFDAQAPRAAAQALEPLRFVAGALVGIVFSALLFLTVLAPRAAAPRARASRLPLLLLVATPVLLSVAYGAIAGGRLKSTWAMPFFSLAGVLAFAWLPTRTDRVALRRFGLALLAVAMLALGAHLSYKQLSARSKTGIDGAALAQAVARDWQARHGTPLRIVAGDHVLSAIVSAYAPSRPSMLVRGDFALSLWLTPAALQRDGAAILCEAAAGDCLPALSAGAGAPRELRVSGRDYRYWLRPPGLPPPAR